MRFTPRYIYSFLEKIAVGILVALTSMVTRDREKAESLRPAVQFSRYCFIWLSDILINCLLYVICLSLILAVNVSFS